MSVVIWFVWSVEEIFVLVVWWLDIVSCDCYGSGVLVESVDCWWIYNGIGCYCLGGDSGVIVNSGDRRWFGGVVDYLWFGGGGFGLWLGDGDVCWRNCWNWCCWWSVVLVSLFLYLKVDGNGVWYWW